MSWSSSFFPSVDKLSIPLSTPSIAANDTLPEHILSSFHSLSMEDLQQINNSLGQQPHESNAMINLLNNSTYNLFNDYLVDLIGCLVYNLIHSKHIFHIFTTCPIFQLEISKSLLTDVVWFWGTQISPETAPQSGNTNNTKVHEKSNDKWQRLCTFVKDLFINKIVEIERLKKSLELNLLVGSGLWHDEAGLQKKLVKINTSLVYRQDKYNLLREETEGYSKLLTVLSTMPSPAEDPFSHIKNVFSIIGYFDLDPNRVLDLILDTMEHQLWNLSFLLLLKDFRKSSITHILGFKFTQFKTTDEKPGESSPSSPFSFHNPTPQTLYALAALLLTVGLISLDELLPYFSPSFQDFKVIINEKSSKLQDEIKSYGVVNLTKKSEAKSATPSIVNAVDSTSPSSLAYADGYQLIGLLAATITVRNWGLAQELIQLIKVHTDVDPFDFEAPRSALISLIDWKIDNIYQPFSFRKYSLAGPGSNTKKDDLPIPDLGAFHFHGAQDVPEDQMEIVQSGLLRGVQSQKIQALESFVYEISPMLFYLGHNLSSSPSLYTKLCRLLKIRMDSLDIKSCDVSQVTFDNLTGDTCDNEVLNIYRIISAVLLPSLSRIDCNPAISALCWSVVSVFPFNTRFTMYEIWKGEGLGKQGIGNKPLEMAFAEARTLQSAKTCLKRLSKENTKAMGRQLAKSTHSCPLVVFNQILSQIEVYDNMIPFVVEALKYTTELARDVMAYALLSQLRKDSNKLKPGDTHYSGWFSALSKFIGSFYKRYPTTELYGLLHYLLERMSTGSSLDLLVLKELLGRMGGCDTLLDVSSQQLEGLAGGRTLQAEVMGAQVKDNVNKKAVRVLRDTMLSSGTALPLLLFIAQSRSNILYQNSEGSASQLKLISYLYDTCQDVLMQFTDFLLSSGANGNGKGAESLVEFMPPMRYLLSDVGLAIPIAFQLVRPLVRAALQYGDRPESAPANLQQWHPFSNEMKDVVCQYLPEDIWCAISPELYLTFWSLSLYDVFLPKLKYEAEIKRLKEKYTELDQKNSVNEDRLTVKQRRADMTKLLNLTNTLKEELDAQRKHVDIIRTMIINSKRTYLTHVTSELSPKTTEYIMQYCLFSRVILSPTDAIFCSQFFMLLHSLETPGFSTIHYIDKTMKTVAPLIFCSTEYEASFIGFYINDLLEICNRWIVSKTAYNKEAKSKCGMEKTFGSKGTDGRASHEEFLNVCKIWHKKLSSILVSCLKSSEYMHIRSALVFLSKVVQQFPTRTSGGKMLLTCVEGIDKEDNDKEDLKIMAKSVAAILKKRSSTWFDDEPKEKPKRPVPIKRNDTEEKINTPVPPPVKNEPIRSLPPRDKSASIPPSSSTGSARPKTDTAIASGAPKSVQSEARNKPETSSNPPKANQSDTRPKDDQGPPNTSRNNTSDSSRAKDSSPSEAPPNNPPSSNGSSDRQAPRPNKRGREEDRPPSTPSAPPPQNAQDKGRPLKPNPPPRNPPSQPSSSPAPNTLESDTNAAKRPRPSGPTAPEQKQPDTKVNKPLAPPVSNAPPSNNQASSQTSGRKDFAQSNNAIPSTPAPTSTQSSQSGPPLSDIEKREQRFGGGNRGGMGRGPPPPSNVPPNRTNHDSNSSNGNNDRRDANKGIRR